MDALHCKNVRVILTLSGLAQLHLFRGFYVVKCKGHFNHENTSCVMWATIETSERMHCIIYTSGQMQLDNQDSKFMGHFNPKNASCIMWATIETSEQMQLRQPRQG